LWSIIYSASSHFRTGTFTISRKHSISSDAKAPGRPPGRANRTRENVKKVATELLIQFGLHNTSFSDIAARLGVTTPNLHYHFGSKQKLVEEVVQDYVRETVKRQAEIWLDPDKSLAAKLRAALEFNRERYNRFNKGKRQGQAWSLIGRLRLEGNALSPSARSELADYSTSIQAMIKTAVERAQAKGELGKNAPAADISFLMANMVNSSSGFTQDAGSFDVLEAYFEAFASVVLSAHGPGASRKRHQTAKLP
jgi:TetR/AcrR family transcriptional repressor of nem operon